MLLHKKEKITLCLACRLYTHQSKPNAHTLGHMMAANLLDPMR